MTPQEVLSHPPRILSQEQREAYFEQGFVLCKGLLDGQWLTRMQDAYTRAVERSRGVTGSNTWFSLQRDHTAECPRIQRIEKLPDQDPEFWQVVVQSRVADATADVVGPDVKYRDSMINVKAPGEGGRVSWHQDLLFYPHTNSSTIQVLTALYDVTPDQGPLTVIKGSHLGEIFEHYDDNDEWTGEISLRDMDRVCMDHAIDLPCEAGDAILLHPLTVHSSGPNRSERSRPLLIHGMSAADAMSYTPMTWGNSHTNEIVRGQPARWAHHEDLRLRLPPDWSEGYTSIFEHQAVDAAE